VHHRSCVGFGLTRTAVNPPQEGLAQITALEEDLVSMFDELVAKLARGGLSVPEISTGLMVFKHVNDTLAERRRLLSGPGFTPPRPATVTLPDDKTIQ
jgi:hypothetical protein